METFHLSEDVQRVLKEIHAFAFTIKETPQTYREINHYEERGLFKAKRSGEKGWRRFNANDIIWLQLIHSLRAFGMPISTLKKISKVVYKSKGKVPFFELELAFYILKKEEVYFVTTIEGKFEIIGSQKMKMDSAFISIPLTPVFLDVWKKIQSFKGQI